MTNTANPNKYVTFSVTFRDEPHFYRVVKWMNANVGYGSKSWTIKGSVKKKLKKGAPVKKDIYVFSESFDAEESSLFLNLA